MEVLVGGAALGAAFELLFKTVILATLRVSNYNSDLNRLKQTLYSIKLVIEDIQKFNKILDRPPNETEMFIDRLIEGEKLVLKSSKVKWINVFKRLYYSIQIRKLENLLVRFFHVDVGVLHFRETKKIAVGVIDLEKKVNEIVTLLKGGKIGGEVIDDGSSFVVLNKIYDDGEIKDLGERRRIWKKGRLVEQTLIRWKGNTVWEDTATLPVIRFSPNGPDEPMFPASTTSDEHASSLPWSDYVI